jgi:hypothetical protein
MFGMRRAWLYIIGAVLVAAAITAAALAMKNSSNGNKAAQDNSSDNSAAAACPGREACKIFSLADAKQVLGDSAKGGNSGPAVSSEDMSVSACSYTQDSGSNAPVSTSKAASLKVSATKSGAGITSNQNQFGPAKPSGAQQVTGYGDDAFWDAQYGQLNILKNNRWYILSSGPITPADRTLDQAKQLADLLIDKM